MYINVGNDGFRAARNGEYIDKSDLIEIVNASLNSERQFICVSRARRFGKSMAAKMLNAYYNHSCHSEALFQDLKIAKKTTFPQHLNKYPVLYVDMTNFITRYRNSGDIVHHIKADILTELREAYPNVRYGANDDMLSVNRLYDERKERFPGYKTALLHGRLKSEEKESIMEDFAKGRVQVLVSTIVIEVGIDVPEASIIVIENSERFGLAQMHQLRGRVGRSDIQSYCYVINYSKSETAEARARAMAEISDGFEISEVDYELRGPGDIMGTVQSGNLNSNILTLSRNTALLEAAMADADRIMNTENKTDMEYAYNHIMKDAANDNSDII